MKRQFRKYLIMLATFAMLLSVVFPSAPVVSAEDTVTSTESGASATSVSEDVYSTEPSMAETTLTENETAPSVGVVSVAEVQSPSVVQDSNKYSIEYAVKNRKTGNNSPQALYFVKPATFKVEYNASVGQATYHVSLNIDNPTEPLLTDFELKQNGEGISAHVSDLIQTGDKYNQRSVTFDVYDLTQKIDVDFNFKNIKRENSIEFDPSTIKVAEETTPPVTSPEPEVPLQPGSLDFTILTDKSQDVSVMDGYAVKPAKLVQKANKWYVQLTIKNSSWIPSFQTEQNGKYEETTTVSTEGDQRTIEFEVGNLSNKVNAYAHIIVPGLELGGVPYDHWYNVQIQFNGSVTPDPGSSLQSGSIDFSVLKDKSQDMSVMDGYTLKPAKVVQKGNKWYVQLTIKNSSWIPSFQTEQNGKYEEAATVSTEGDQRIVEFEIRSLSNKVNAYTHVIVPGLELGGVPYDHWYNVQIQFNGNVTPDPGTPSTLVDGTYSINFDALHATKDQASSMARYLVSPATLTVTKGKYEVSIQIKDSATITKFKTEQNGTLTDVDIVSEDKASDTRMARFPLADVDAILNAQVHVSTSYNGTSYEMDHTIRLKFDRNSITLKDSTPTNPGTPSTLADGTYSISFDALHATKDQASAMARYLVSPATLTVSKGKYEASFTIKDSATVTEFKTEQNGTLTDADVVSVDKKADTRVVKFKVADLDAILNAQVHVNTSYNGTVYEMDHKIRLQFDRSSLAVKGTDGGTTPGTENGKYSIDFSVLKNGSNEISVMDGYMQKPATLLKESGKNLIQIKMDKSSWIKTFKVNGAEAQVIDQSTSADTRTVQFEVADLSDKVSVNTHVIVPGLDLGGIPYDHVYDVQYQFEPATIRSFVEPSSTGAADPIVKLDFDKLANGKYVLKFSIVLADGTTGENSPAQRFIANEPAQLVVEGDKRFVDLKLQNSNEVKALRIWDNASGGYKDAEVTQEDAASNTKNVRFSVSDFKNNVKGQLVVYEAPKVASAAPMVFKAEDRVEKVYDFEFKFNTSEVTYYNDKKTGEVEKGKSNLADGEYTASFRVLANGTDKDSLVAPFVQSLAKLVVKNGKVQAHLTVTDNQALKLFQTDFEGRYANPTVVGSNTKGDTHTIAFEVPDLDQKLSVYTQVYLPEKFIVNEKFGGQIQFDRASLKGEGVNAATTAPATEQTAETPTPVAETKPVVEQPAQTVTSEKQYSINYNVFKDKTSEASVMDGYLDKPATLIEKGDKRYIQVTLKNSSWMPILQVEQNGSLKDVEVISTSGDTRVIQFEAGDLSRKISAYTHVIVPGLVLGGVPYDHWYTVQFQFDEASLKAK
ncbi:NEAT domain-containing protein [Paenibacillus sp. NRS-1780]|uniref:NEAT domain-containing protein n=2 Tax=Paenibacillus TaxID=44249 RepID=UPI003D2A034C